MVDKFNKYIKFLKNLVWFILFACLCFFLLDKIFVKADTLTSNFSTNFYYCKYNWVTGSDIGCNNTGYRSSNSVNYYGSNSHQNQSMEYPRGFYVWLKDVKFEKDFDYTLTINITFSNLEKDAYKNTRINDKSLAWFSLGDVKSVYSTYKIIPPTSSTDNYSVNTTIQYQVHSTTSGTGCYIGSVAPVNSSMFYFDNDATSNMVITTTSYSVSKDGMIISQNNTIINQNNEMIDEQKKTNDTLTDDDSSGDWDISKDIHEIGDGAVSDIVTMPLTLLNAYMNGMSSTCSPVNLGTLLGELITFPCIDISDKLGSNLWGTIDGLMSIFMIYNIAMLILSMYNKLTELEELDPYSPEHAYTGYKPKHGGGD